MWKKSSWLKFHVTVHEFVHIEHVYEYTLVIVNILSLKPATETMKT